VTFSVSGAFFFEALDPAGYIQSMTEPLKAATPEMIGRGGLLVSSVFFALGLVASYGWLLYAWSAFREVNRVSKVRSFSAYILCSSAGLLATLPLYIMSGVNTKF
jgi:hypothetical protein